MGLLNSFPGLKAAYAEIAGGSINTPRAKPFPTVLILMWCFGFWFFCFCVFLSYFIFGIESDRFLHARVFAGR